MRRCFFFVQVRQYQINIFVLRSTFSIETFQLDQSARSPERRRRIFIKTELFSSNNRQNRKFSSIFFKTDFFLFCLMTRFRELFSLDWMVDEMNAEMHFFVDNTKSKIVATLQLR